MGFLLWRSSNNPKDKGWMTHDCSSASKFLQSSGKILLRVLILIRKWNFHVCFTDMWLKFKIQNWKFKKISPYLLLHYNIFAFYYFFPLGFILLNSCQVLFFCPRSQSPWKIYTISIIALITLSLPSLSNLFYIPFSCF